MPGLILCRSVTKGVCDVAHVGAQTQIFIRRAFCRGRAGAVGVSEDRVVYSCQTSVSAPNAIRGNVAGSLAAVVCIGADRPVTQRSNSPMTSQHQRNNNERETAAEASLPRAGQIQPQSALCSSWRVIRGNPSRAFKNAHNALVPLRGLAVLQQHDPDIAHVPPAPPAAAPSRMPFQNSFYRGWPPPRGGGGRRLAYGHPLLSR